jgi:hypothetical protein
MDKKKQQLMFLFVFNYSVVINEILVVIIIACPYLSLRNWREKKNKEEEREYKRKAVDFVSRPGSFFMA